MPQEAADKRLEAQGIPSKRGDGQEDGRDKRLEAWRDFLLGYRLIIDRLEDELVSERDLPLAWYDVLVQLAAAPGLRLTMKDLAASVLLSASGLTRLVDRLEERKLVARQRCPDDRRKWFVVLTQTGLKELRAAAPVHLRGIGEHFGRHLSEAEADAFRCSLAKMIDPLREPRSERIREKASL